MPDLGFILPPTEKHGCRKADLAFRRLPCMEEGLGLERNRSQGDRMGSTCGSSVKGQ